MRERSEHWRTGTDHREMDIAVWRAVRYLDSSTDYREYLPRSGRALKLANSDFVMLDNEEFRWGKPCVITVIAVFVCMILLFCARG
jgi:hypothetical protein